MKAEQLGVEPTTLESLV